MKKSLLAVISAVVLALCTIPFTETTHAITVTGCGISNPGTVNEGGQYSVSYTVTTNDSMTASLAVGVSGGGSLVSVSANVGSVNGNRIVVSGVDGITSISGNITFNVVNSSPVAISISGDVSSINDFSSAGVGGSISINVYSKAQQNADAAAAEESRRQQEAYNASVAASQAVESSIAASKYAESSKAQQEIDDSIAAEQASIQESEAAIESSVNASIAESASIEESIIQESLSVEESIEQSSIALAESISESESEVERTKAVQIGKEYYVPFKSGRNKFLFATEEAELGVPEGFEKTDLMVNMQYVWAYRNSEMSAHAYLVYGRYEKDDESAYYFYDETNGVFFPYERLYAEEGVLQVPNGFGSVVNTTEGTKEKGIGSGLIAILCIVSALLGAGIAVLVFMLFKRNAAEQGVAAVPADDDDSFVQDADTDDIEEFGEEYEFENKGVGLEEEDVFVEKTINVQNNGHNNASENADTPKNKAINAAIAEAETETVIGNIKFDMTEEASIPSSGSVIPAETVEAAEVSEIEIEELEVLEELSIDRK